MAQPLARFLKILAVICVILFSFVLPLASVMHNFNRTIFNPSLMKEVLSFEAANSDLIPAALELFSTHVAQRRVKLVQSLTWILEPGNAKLISLTDREDWQQLMTIALTDDILKGWISAMVDASYAWIDNKDSLPQISLDLESLKKKLSQNEVDFITIFLKNLPDCSATEIADFTARLETAPTGTSVSYNLCLFPDPWRENQFNGFIDVLTRGVENIPAQFNLTEEMKPLENLPQGAGNQSFKQLLQNLRNWTKLAWLAPLILLALITALSVRSLRSLTRWWGPSMLASGLLSFLPPIIYRPLLTRILATGFLRETPNIIKGEVIHAILGLADWVFLPMLLLAILLSLIGMGLLAWLNVSEEKVSPGR